MKSGKPASSRLVTATLCPPNSTCTSGPSTFCPTYAVKREVKSQFYDELQPPLDVIPSNECYVVLGDFNTCAAQMTWETVCGPYGLNEANDVGYELLQFSSMYATHGRQAYPKSKPRHCIDFAIMRQRDRRKCLEIWVK